MLGMVFISNSGGGGGGGEGRQEKYIYIIVSTNTLRVETIQKNRRVLWLHHPSVHLV